MTSSSGMKVDVAELAGIMVEGPLFGICCVLDIAAIYILLRRKRSTGLNIPMLAAAVIMLALVISQFAVDAANIFTAFIDLSDQPRLSRIAFFQDLTQPIFAAKHAIFFTMMFVGDAIVIYRCYVVWNRKFWIVLVPILCSLASAVCAYQIIWRIRHHPDFHSIFFKLVRNMGLAIFALSFGANAIATSLLSYKIWDADRVLKKMTISNASRMSRLPIIRIIIESGAINTAYLLVYTLMLQTGSNGIEVMACIVTPLLGIIFSMVIIRAAMAAEFQGTTVVGGSGTVATGVSFPGRQSQGRNLASTTEEIRMSTHVESWSDSMKHSDHPYKAQAL